MPEMPHTAGFCRIAKWQDGEAQLWMGLTEPDSTEWRWAGWIAFRSEADAREFVRRWNAHEALKRAVQLGLNAFCDPHELATDPAAVKFKALADAALKLSETST